MILHTEDDARTFCAELGDVAGMARLETLAKVLLAENKQQNLIAKTSEENLWLRHFADSAQLLTLVPRETSPWLDLGTGAGFPGLVIAALRPDIDVLLVESRKKRTDFLEHAACSMGLTKCRVVTSRLEMVGTFSTAVISARAFAPLAKLLSLSARFSTHDTRWLLPKGRSAGQELKSLPGRVREMFHVEPSMTDVDAGILVGTGRPEL